MTQQCKQCLENIFSKQLIVPDIFLLFTSADLKFMSSN